MKETPKLHFTATKEVLASLPACYNGILWQIGQVKREEGVYRIEKLSPLHHPYSVPEILSMPSREYYLQAVEPDAEAKTAFVKGFAAVMPENFDVVSDILSEDPVSMPWKQEGRGLNGTGMEDWDWWNPEFSWEEMGKNEAHVFLEAGYFYPEK